MLQVQSMNLIWHWIVIINVENLILKLFFKVIDESEKNDDTRKISAISKKLQPLGLYTPFKDISELKDNVSKILQAEVMNLIRKQGQVMPEIHKYIEISDTNEFISNFHLIIN